MSRITGSEVASMMEAYNAVYAPQELTEEQAWQEVEEWVNSLVEEGYDLSEYTWEDMYEEYITEIGVNFGGQAAVNRVLSQASGGGGRIGQPGSAGMVDYKNKAGQVKSAYKSSSDGKLYKNYNDALAAKNSRMQGLAVQQGLNRTYRAGGGNAAVAQGRSPLDVMKQGATNLGAQQRPATPTPSAARPVQPPVGGQRPATPTPSAARPAQPPVAGQRPATPTPSGSAPTSRPGGFGVPTAPLAARSSVSSATAPGSVPSGTSVAVKPATAAAPTSRPSLASQTAELQQMRKASQQRIMAQGGKPATPLVQSFDLFDVVMGHLIDEGYADSEEAALTIMANMSEEWKESIMEVRGGGKVEFKPIFRGPSGNPGGRITPNRNQDPQHRRMSSYPGHKTSDKITQLNHEKSKTPKGSPERGKLETRIDKLQKRFERDGKGYQDFV